MKAFCQISYELALLLVATVLVLSPMHQAATLHYNIDHTCGRDWGDSTIVFRTNPAGRVKPGHVLAAYRFERDWPTELGRVVVRAVKGDEATASYQPEALRWPIGRHGRVLSENATGVTLNIGSELSLKRGEELVVFRERQSVGRIRLEEVAEGSSRAAILSGPKGSLSGLTVSEYPVATQVILYRGGIASYLEIGAVLGVMLVYAGGYWRYRRSPLLVLGENCRPRLARCFANPALRRIGIALTLAPFIWFVGGLMPGLAVLFLEKLAAHVPSLHTQVPSLDTFAARAWPWVKERLWVIYLGLGLVCLGFWWRKGRSPVLAFWNVLAWRPQFYSRFPSFGRHLTIWCLHLLIAFAFAHSLLGFLQENLEAMVKTGWPTSDFVFAGSLKLLHPASALAWAKSFAALLVYITTHAPRPASVGAAFEASKFGLWSLTVVGCLVGYAHSVLSPLWGKRIRNLDFTAAGWITNALCYPLLGLAAWRLVPSPAGPDPILTAGPLFQIVQWLALACNLFYMLSIWNLGTKFGVMTDKGVRTTGYYATVRHPSYALEVCMFMLLELAGFSGLAQWMGIALIPLLYWLRSEREDVFMARSNPDYVIYRSATPYKFVPGFY